MNTHCQHTFQFKQLIKVNVALYDPFNNQNMAVSLSVEEVQMFLSLIAEEQI